MELEISDQVKGGCWVNANSVLTAAKLVLSRSDIRIVDTGGMIERAINMDKSDERPPPFPNPLSFVMSAIGYDLNNSGCVVSLKIIHGQPFRLFYIEDLLEGGTGYTSEINENGSYVHPYDPQIYLDEAVMSGPKSGFSQRIKEHFIAYAEEFAYLTILARQKLQKDHGYMFRSATEREVYSVEFWGAD